MPFRQISLRQSTVLGASCAVLLAGLLAACLWPFQSPTNDVSWLEGKYGLRFGRHGTVLSRGLMIDSDGDHEPGVTLEAWLQPERVSDSGTVLAFYRPGESGGFSVHQSGEDVLLRNGPWPVECGWRLRQSYASNVFRARNLVMIAVSSGADGTSVYADGELVRRAWGFHITPDDVSGVLVVANSPVVSDSWPGDLRGLALYGRELGAAEILRHYQTWKRDGRPQLASDDRTSAVYLFDEGSGRVVHNRTGSAGDLYIPERYMELHHILLRTPWDEYRPGWGYWKDVVINIGGFVPLGFLFCAYFSLSLSATRPVFLTTGLGFLVSLSVEFLQAYIPTRDSGVTDVITNTLGTILGAQIFFILGPTIQKLAGSRFAFVRFAARCFS